MKHLNMPALRIQASGAPEADHELEAGAQTWWSPGSRLEQGLTARMNRVAGSGRGRGLGERPERLFADVTIVCAGEGSSVGSAPDSSL